MRLEEALELFEQQADDLGAAQELSDLSMVARQSGRPADAQALVERSLAIYRSCGDDAHSSTQLTRLGIDAIRAGNLPAARSFLDEALAIARATGHPAGLAFVNSTLAGLSFKEGDLAGAGQFLAESLRLQRALGRPIQIAHLLDHFALLAALRDRTEAAVRVLAAADTLYTATGASRLPSGQALVTRWIKTKEEMLDQVQRDAGRAEGAAMTLEEAIAYAAREAR